MSLACPSRVTEERNRKRAQEQKYSQN